MTTVRIVDHAVLRVAAWPVEALADLDAPELARCARQLTAGEANHQAASAQLADRLHTEVRVATDTPSRRWLLEARRALHSGGNVPGHPPHSIEAGLAAEIGVLAAQRQQLAIERARFTEEHGRVVDEQRRSIRCLGADRAFGRALALAFPGLSERWDRACGDEPTAKARDRRLDQAVTRQLLRAVGRPAPNAAWAGYAAVVPGETRPQASLQVEAASRRVVAAVDLRVFAAVLEAWGRQLGPADDHALRADPSLHQRAGEWWYVKGEPGGARASRVPDHPLLAGIIGWFQDGEARTPGPLVGALTGESPAPASERARALIGRLLSLGILRSALALPAGGSDPWEVLDEAADLLPSRLRRHWERATGTALGVCETLSDRFDELESHEVRALSRQAQRAISELFATAGLTGETPDPVIRVTLGLGIRVRWDDAARAGAAEAVGAALDELGADGCAEAVRDRAAGAITALSPRSLPEVLARLVDQGELAADSVPQTRDDAVRAVGLDPAALDTARSPADPGPTGTAILVPADRHWFRWGRPQPGFVTCRAADVLGADGARALETLRAELRAVDAVEIRGIDPDNPNASVGPRLTEPIVSAHDVARVRVERDAASNSPLLVVGDSAPRLAVYSGSSVIGRRDAASRLLRMLAMAHGWELVGWGAPLPAADDLPPQLPERVAGGETVLAPCRWTLSAPVAATLATSSGADRYLAWRTELDRRGAPDLVLARFGVRPDSPEVALPTTSPLAADSLLAAAGDGSEPLVLTALPDVGSWPVTTPAGHHLAELAVTWTRTPNRRPRR